MKKKQSLTGHALEIAEKCSTIKSYLTECINKASVLILYLLRRRRAVATVYRSSFKLSSGRTVFR